ncbi:MAG: hypothetical protein LC729_03565 [Acidobacteria bacterium]|nr:hypothetical protein [Acidobacteriota bacterium]
MKKIHLTGLTQEELVSFVEELAEPAYRGRQIFAALQHRRLRAFDDVTDLPKDLRTKLQEQATASSLTVESRYIRGLKSLGYENVPVEQLVKLVDNGVSVAFIEKARADFPGL